jgi:hypothetical protein
MEVSNFPLADLLTGIKVLVLFGRRVGWATISLDVAKKKETILGAAVEEKYLTSQCQAEGQKVMMSVDKKNKGL